MPKKAFVNIIAVLEIKHSKSIGLYVSEATTYTLLF